MRNHYLFLECQKISLDSVAARSESACLKTVDLAVGNNCTEFQGTKKEFRKKQGPHHIGKGVDSLLQLVMPARRSQLWKYEPSKLSMCSRVMPFNSCACANNFTKFKTLVPSCWTGAL